MSWPRSNMPLIQPMPMSAVPPSPAWAMILTFSYRPMAFSATSMPAATAAAFSKRE